MGNEPTAMPPSHSLFCVSDSPPLPSQAMTPPTHRSLPTHSRHSHSPHPANRHNAQTTRVSPDEVPHDAIPICPEMPPISDTHASPPPADSPPPPLQAVAMLCLPACTPSPTARSSMRRPRHTRTRYTTNHPSLPTSFHATIQTDVGSSSRPVVARWRSAPWLLRQPRHTQEWWSA